MSRVTIACGAGVSSSFLAQRLLASAESRMPELGFTFSASSFSALGSQNAGDVILLGPHLVDQYERVVAEHPLARVGIVTEQTLRAFDGDAALDQVLQLLASAEH